MSKMNRRQFIAGTASSLIIPGVANAGGPTPWPHIGFDRLWIRNTHGEQLKVVHWNGASYDTSAVRMLSWLWRDWRDADNAVYIDPRLFTYLANIQTHLSLLSREPRQIVMNSGYRTPRRNATIEGAAPNSQHIHGKACDFNIEGVRPSDVHQVASSYNVPGLGRYRNFTHIDVGPSGRRWG